jgi:hypothetical protein
MALKGVWLGGLVLTCVTGVNGLSGAAETPATTPKTKVSALQPGTGTQYYTAPDGKPDNDGSKDKPWDLQTAMAHPKPVKPGDTIWLRGGTHKAKSWRWTLKGEKDKPIMVAQYPGERATIVGRISVVAPSAYTWYWDFEITSASPNRVSKEKVSWPPGDLESSGLDIMDNEKVDGPGLKFIHVVVHDTNSSGFNLWHQATDAELYGCLAYYNGWVGPGDDRNHGHGIYTQNKTGLKRLADNILFKQFMFGIQLYGSGSAFVDNYDYIGNVAFNNGAPGGRLEINFMLSPVNCDKWHFIVNDNHCYQPDLNRTNASIGYVWHKEPYEKVTFNNNMFVGPTYVYWWRQINATGNTFIGKVEEVELKDGKAKVDRTTNNFLAGKPTKGLQVFVRPSEYEAGRANVIIYNWEKADSVQVNLKDVLAPGAAYEVRDAQNFYGDPVVKGMFDDKPVSVPMKNLTVANPIGIAPDPLLKHTAPEFGVFIVMTPKKAE